MHAHRVREWDLQPLSTFKLLWHGVSKMRHTDRQRAAVIVIAQRG